MQQLSIVIPSRDEGGRLYRTVESMMDTARHAFIVVVDDGSMDGSVDQLPKCGRLKVVETGGGYGVAAARNFGEHRAPESHYVAFADAHTSAEPGWVDELLDGFGVTPAVAAVCPAVESEDNPNAVGCGMGWNGPMLPVTHGYTWTLPETRSLTGFVPGGFSVWDRRVWRRIGGYDEECAPWGAEDGEISMRAWLMGYELVAEPAVRVKHYFKSKSPHPAGESWGNYLRWSVLHHSPRRIMASHADLARWPDLYDRAVAHAYTPRTLRKREAYAMQRVRDDGAYHRLWGGDPLGG